IPSFHNRGAAWESQHPDDDFICVLADGRRINKHEFLRHLREQPRAETVGLRRSRRPPPRRLAVLATGPLSPRAKTSDPVAAIPRLTGQLGAQATPSHQGSESPRSTLHPSSLRRFPNHEKWGTLGGPGRHLACHRVRRRRGTTVAVLRLLPERRALRRP